MGKSCASSAKLPHRRNPHGPPRASRAGTHLYLAPKGTTNLPPAIMVIVASSRPNPSTPPTRRPPPKEPPARRPHLPLPSLPPLLRFPPKSEAGRPRGDYGHAQPERTRAARAPPGRPAPCAKTAARAPQHRPRAGIATPTAGSVVTGRDHITGSCVLRTGSPIALLPSNFTPWKARIRGPRFPSSSTRRKAKTRTIRIRRPSGKRQIPSREMARQERVAQQPRPGADVTIPKKKEKQKKI